MNQSEQSMKFNFRTLLGLLALSVFGFRAAPMPAAEPALANPNIVIILADDKYHELIGGPAEGLVDADSCG